MTRYLSSLSRSILPRRSSGQLPGHQPLPDFQACRRQTARLRCHHMPDPFAHILAVNRVPQTMLQAVPLYTQPVPLLARNASGGLQVAWGLDPRQRRVAPTIVVKG